MSKKGLYALVLLIVFAVYNVLVFTIAGFTGHTAAFWISYIFVAIALVMVALAGLVVGKKQINMGNWFFSFPIVKHIFTYAAIELCVSVVFMLLDGIEFAALPTIAFVVQFLLLCIYAVVIIVCIMARNTIDESNTEVKKKTVEFGMIKAEANKLVNMCSDAAVKARLEKFAENVRYSDPMSVAAVKSIEDEIKSLMKDIEGKLLEKDFDGASIVCDRADLLLKERNEKVKLLK